jgi:CubicO group peptidase (beta-lactamase class C family)
VFDEIESTGILCGDGAFNTRFWIDPKEDLIGILMTQSDQSTGIANRYRAMVYQAIED